MRASVKLFLQLDLGFSGGAGRGTGLRLLTARNSNAMQGTRHLASTRGFPRPSLGTSCGHDGFRKSLQAPVLTACETSSQYQHLLAFHCSQFFLQPCVLTPVPEPGVALLHNRSWRTMILRLGDRRTSVPTRVRIYPCTCT